MENTPRTPKADTKRRLIETGAKPVLARLPDVSSELLRLRPGKNSAGNQVGYRFDPAQSTDRGSRAADGNQPPQSTTLKSELVYAPQTSRPHVFERSRTTERSARLPRRESPVLPRTNPFSIPRRGLLDSLTPALRFMSLVVLFAAAGTWFQLSGTRNRPELENETPKTTAEQPAAPANKSTERPAHLPTALGPVGTTPEANTRVGRARSSNDFATLRGDVMPIAPSTPHESLNDAATPTFPSLVGAGGGELPRVQTAEMPRVGGATSGVAGGNVSGNVGGGDAPARSDEATRPQEVATRVPGFIIAVPSR